MIIKNHKIKGILSGILSFCFVILIFQLFIFNYADAQACNPTCADWQTCQGGVCTPGIHNPVEVDSINEYVEMAVGSLLKILGPIVVLFMVLSGVMFALARGNPEKLAEAKRMLLYTMIGAAIVFGAWLLAELVTDTVGLITEE
jgi:hypothetical protein